MSSVHEKYAAAKAAKARADRKSKATKPKNFVYRVHSETDGIVFYVVASGPQEACGAVALHVGLLEADAWPPEGEGSGEDMVQGLLKQVEQMRQEIEQLKGSK